MHTSVSISRRTKNRFKQKPNKRCRSFLSCVCRFLNWRCTNSCHSYILCVTCQAPLPPHFKFCWHVILKQTQSAANILNRNKFASQWVAHMFVKHQQKVLSMAELRVWWAETKTVAYGWERKKILEKKKKTQFSWRIRSLRTFAEKISQKLLTARKLN